MSPFFGTDLTCPKCRSTSQTFIGGNLTPEGPIFAVACSNCYGWKWELKVLKKGNTFQIETIERETWWISDNVGTGLHH